MAKIISSKKHDDGKVTLELSMNYEESMRLKGNMENLHLISEDVADIKSNISFRGKNESTKYFLIPRQLRKDLMVKVDAACQRIDTDSKIVFVYMLEKDKLKQLNDK